jgi:hypothetical protein
VRLKDRGELKYRGMARLSGIAGVRINALGSLCRYEKSRMKS